MSSLVTGGEWSVGGKISRSGFETRSSRPPASTVVASLAPTRKLYGKRPRGPASRAVVATSPYARAVSSGLEQRIPVTLRWRDMDLLGHLNQSVYHELLEEGRAALMWDLMRRAGDDHGRGTYVLAHVDLDYHTEVRKDHGHVDVVVRVSGVGRSSFRLQHELRLPDGTVAASGETVMVAWDPVARGKRALTEGELAALG